MRANSILGHHRANAVTICHCRFCQKGTGSAYLVEPIFSKANFALTSGEPKVYQHRSEGSGKLVDVHFCGHCGTKLFLSFERFPSVVGLYAGTFDDPNWFERSTESTRHIFLSVAQRRTIIPAGFKCYQEHATGNDRRPIKPAVFDQSHVVR